MAFKCLTHAYTILIGLVLSLRDKEEKRVLTHLGSNYWGQWIIGPLEHSRVQPWPEFPNCFHRH